MYSILYGFSFTIQMFNGLHVATTTTDTHTDITLVKKYFLQNKFVCYFKLKYTCHRYLSILCCLCFTGMIWICAELESQKYQDLNPPQSIHGEKVLHTYITPLHFFFLRYLVNLMYVMKKQSTHYHSYSGDTRLGISISTNCSWFCSDKGYGKHSAFLPVNMRALN